MSASDDDTKPVILSFNEFSIDLDKDVELFLSSQYEDLHIDDADTKRKAQEHWNIVKSCMKKAPKHTFCRVNQISAKREDVIEELNTVLTSIMCNNKGNDVKFRAQADETFEDCITIDATSPPLDFASFHHPPLDGKDRLCSMPDYKRAHRIHLGWPDTHHVIVCDRLCGEAVLRGSDIFVSGILSADLGVREGEQIAVYVNLKLGNVPMARGMILKEYRGHCMFLGLGISCCSRATMFNTTKGLGVRMFRGVSSLPPLNGVLPDKIRLQNLPSVLVTHCLDLQPGQVILDMCAAPGGKTAHLASLVRNRGLIVACDKSRKKMVQARDMFQTIGATCIVPLALDSTKILAKCNENDPWMSVEQIISTAKTSPKDNLLNIKKFHPKSFDRILLDPPCSALGLRPKLHIQISKEDLQTKYPNFQKMFINNAVSLLKPGGIMTYSTCTINAQENECMVAFILREFGCMELMPIGVDVGLWGLPGMGLDDKQRCMVRRFDPSHDADTIGFFVAKFRKEGI